MAWALAQISLLPKTELKQEQQAWGTGRAGRKGPESSSFPGPPVCRVPCFLVTVSAPPTASLAE